ncbi:MAG: cellulose biosynthesis cyclic di-GMP-binding regulatory protein BcsB, partial [Verrucomicrobiota bacterium]
RMVEAPLELELSVNGEVFDTIVLDHNQGEKSSSRRFQVIATAPDGLHWQTGLRFEIPMIQFRSGWNDVSFRLAGPVGMEGLMQSKSFAIRGDSRITVPAATPSGEVPDLALMSRSSFPFVPQPDGSNLEIALLEPNRESILAGWNLLAKLAQVANTFLYNAHVHFGPAMGAREVLVVGRVSKVQPLLAETSLADLDLVGEIRDGGAFLQALKLPEESDEVEVGIQNGERNRVTTYFATTKIEDLEPFSRELIKEKWWNEINGDFAVLRKNGVLETVQIAEAIRLYEKPEIGIEDRGMFFDLVIKPFHWAGVLLALSLPFAFLTRVLLGPE